MTGTMDDVTAAVSSYASEQVRSATVRVEAERDLALAEAASVSGQLAAMADARDRLYDLYNVLPAGWGRAVFVEDFGGSLSKWHVRDGTTQKNTSCNNFARNVTTRPGVGLVMAGRRERTTVQSGSTTRTCDYSSGYVDTDGSLLSIEKGSRVEIEAILPTVVGIGPGIWPALWFRDKLGKGEFDLAEGWSEPTAGAAALRTPPDLYRSGSFSSSCYANTDDQAAGKRSNWGTPVGAPAIGGKAHKFVFEWDAVGMRASLDDNAPHLAVTYAATPWLAAAFPSKLALRMNLQIGSAYWGQPTEQTALPVEFVVRSVRVLRP